MKCFLKLILGWLILFSLLLTPYVSAETLNSNGDPIKLRLDGKLVPLDQPPIIDSNGRTLVPLRFVAEQLGTDVEWDSRSQSALISKGIQTVILTVGETEVSITNSRTKTIATKKLDTAAIIENRRILVPVRFISETLGLEVKWNNYTRTVNLYTSP